MKKELNILIALILLWVSGIVAAPFFSGTDLSFLLYKFYSAVCHQFDSRSFHLHGEKFAVCIRCTAIYAGFLSAIIVVRLSPELRTAKLSSVPVIVLSSLPMVIDGSLSLLNIHGSTTVLRLATGSIFGIGMALLLHHSLTEIIQSFTTRNRKAYEPKTG